MMLVRCSIKPSPIHGIGLFTDEFIPKGSAVWTFLRPFDVCISATMFESLPDRVKLFWRHWGWCADDMYFLSSDNDRFINHSDTPNVGAFTEDNTSFALVDIPIGTELTENYFEYDDISRQTGIEQN